MFAEMGVIYGHKWNSLFPDADSLALGKAVWAQKLAGLTNKQLRRGVEACAYLSDWNPSVSEFVRAACNLPDKAQCKSRVLYKNCVDPVTYRIYSMLGSYFVSNNSENDIKKAVDGLYEDIYAQTLSETIGNDEGFENPLVSLEQKPEQKQEVDKEAVKKSDEYRDFQKLRAGDKS